MKTTIHIGDCLEVLRTLPAASVQTCITSPPYWGLRDYGTASWVGGDPGCRHRVGSQVSDTKAKGAIVSGVRPGVDASRCLDCGATRSDSQIGLEKTPEDHIAVMVEVFREVRRVLRDDGTLWMNYGDSYAANRGYQVPDGKYKDVGNSKGMKAPAGLKPKDLIGMPWRVALALQADGWWLRSSIIWAKGVSFCDTYSGSVMPESCRDRPTRAHENIFLLSKAPRYFYDADAVREDGPTYTRRAGGYKGRDGNNASRFAGKGGFGDSDVTTTGRNLRDVWIINPQGFPGAHFATFPPALVEPCIKAGTSEKGCCASCGAPIRRVVEATGGTIGEAWHDHSDDLGLGQQKDADGMESYSRETTGWEPTCPGHRPGGCKDAGEPVPCKVLDPFGGAGTAAMVADRLGRDAVLVELNKEYAEMARDRILADCPMFSSVELVGGCKEKTPRNK